MYTCCRSCGFGGARERRSTKINRVPHFHRHTSPPSFLLTFDHLSTSGVLNFRSKARIYIRRIMEARHGQAQSHDVGETTQNTADLTAFVQNLLQQMQSRFQTMSDSIISKIDEMGSRIDDLEKSIGELVKEAGVDVPATPSYSNQVQGPSK